MRVHKIFKQWNEISDLHHNTATSAGNNFLSLSQKKLWNSYVQWNIHELPIKQRWKPNVITLNTTTRPSTWSWEEWGEVVVDITKAYRGIKGKAPLTLNQAPQWRRVVNVTSQLLSPTKRPHYPLNRGLVQLQIWSGCLREAKYLLPLPQLTRRFVYLIT